VSGPANLLVFESGTLIMDALRDAEFRVTRVSFEYALQKVQAVKPAALLAHLEPPVLGEHEIVGSVAMFTEVPVLVVTSRCDERRTVSLLKAGAQGYLFEEDVRLSLRSALDDLLCGGTPMSRDVSRLVLERARRHSTKLTAVAPGASAPPPAARLGERKIHVLQMLAKGLTYDQIGTGLGISVNTVRSHVREIYEALQVSSKVEAVMVAVELGLIERR
jgi:DNA-binding NarL/FixJ family response regulator